jgi:hypothetical protein
MKNNILIICFIISSISLFGQNAENTRFKIYGNRLAVYYDINTPNWNHNYKAEAFYSTDGGSSFNRMLSNAEGDIGSKIKPGKNKKILWDVLKEVGKFEMDKLAFKVDITDEGKIIPMQLGTNFIVLLPYKEEYSSTSNPGLGLDFTIFPKKHFGGRIGIDGISLSSKSTDNVSLQSESFKIFPMDLSVLYRTSNKHIYAYCGGGFTLFMFRQNFRYNYSMPVYKEQKDYTQGTYPGLNCYAGIYLINFFMEFKISRAKTNIISPVTNTNYKLGGEYIIIGYRFNIYKPVL